MRIERLSLKGLLRFADQVDLDFRELPPGLIAITGENGAGKTTILEAMIAALYRTFMSRGDLVDYATGRDSFVEAQYATDGAGTYRARVNLDGPKRTSDAVLHAIRPDGSAVVLNDGKVTTFDAAVAEHFPPQSLLKASAFASQDKSGSFIVLDRKNRKALFANLLGIERYQRMSDTARQAASLVEQSRGRLTAVRDELARGTASGVLDELDRLANQLQAEGGEAETTRVGLKETIATLEARLAVVQDQVAAHALATQRVRTLEGDVAGRRAELLRLEQERAQTIKDAADSRKKLATQMGHQVDDIDVLIANNKKLIENRASVLAAVAALDDANAKLAKLRDQERAMSGAWLETNRTQKVDVELRLQSCDVADRDLARVRQDVAMLGTVPCGGVGVYAPCQFLTSAKAAEARIPALEMQAARRAAAEADMLPLIVNLAEIEEVLRGLRSEIGTHEATVTAQSKMAGLRDKVAAADARIDELQRQRIETIATFSTLDVENTAREMTTLARIDDRFGVVDCESSKLGIDLDQAQVDLEQSAEGNRQAVVLQGQLAETRAQWDVTTGVLARVEAGRAELARRRDEMVARLARLAGVETTITELTDEMLRWQFLAKALGRDGLPVLEIDAAGPTISAYCNQLLTSCDLGRFTVELVTQREKADGKGYVDDFAINVMDNENGGQERDLADLSGGEQIIVSEALRNAISIYVNTTSSMPVRTCWRDETTAALDPENGRRYMQMLRKVAELGGYHHLFYICHSADLTAVADAQIHVHDGKAEILLPPFREAA